MRSKDTLSTLEHAMQTLHPDGHSSRAHLPRQARRQPWQQLWPLGRRFASAPSAPGRFWRPRSPPGRLHTCHVSTCQKHTNGGWYTNVSGDLASVDCKAARHKMYAGTIHTCRYEGLMQVAASSAAVRAPLTFLLPENLTLGQGTDRQSSMISSCKRTCIFQSKHHPP